MHDDQGEQNPSKFFPLETRRAILLALGIAGAGTVAASAASAGQMMPGMRTAPTSGVDLVADSGAHPIPMPLVATRDDILGPFWRAGAPALSNLIPPGVGGRKIVLSGTVMDTDGMPIPNVAMDFWNADETGAYDLKTPHQALDPADFKFRGILKTADDGRYEVQTVVPGKYNIPPNLIGFEEFAGVLRPSHLHLMTSHKSTVPLVTQIYFAEDPDIANDPWAGKSRNVVKIDKSADIWRATFDVVLVRYT